MLYNWATTGSPVRNVYGIIGVQSTFQLRHAVGFLPFYIISLLVAPVAGWAAFSGRWAGGWTLPVSVGAVIVVASTYYYRDGMNYGPAGWIPGQRFLLPASLLACVPAARCLQALRQQLRFSSKVVSLILVSALAVFVMGFALISSYHQAYLKAHGTIQTAIRNAIPDRARVVSNDRVFKEFAPVNGIWTVRLMRYGRVPTEEERAGAYIVWLGLPGEHPPAGWLAGRSPLVTQAKSWVWSRDLWIATPEGDLSLREPRRGHAE
jgi:hypothetical protein